MKFTCALPVALFAAASLLLAGCGGDDGDDSETAKDAPKRDSRVGYFDSGESDALNPAIAAYEAARVKEAANADACNTRSTKLYEQGTPPRVSVKCHLDDTAAVVTSLGKLSTAAAGIKGDFREQCDEQLADYREVLAELEQAWKRVNADWEAYASGDASRNKLMQKDVDQAASVANTFATDVSVKLRDACYTKSDLAEADEAAAKVADKQDDKG